MSELVIGIFVGGSGSRMGGAAPGGIVETVRQWLTRSKGETGK